MKERYGISQEDRHLLVLDGHGSHVTLEVVEKARSEGLDIITLPSHTSHRLQPLDVSIFKPFKVVFRACRDRWTIDNKGKGARKEELAEWVSMGLKKALTVAKITKGFAATGIWPLRPTAMEPFMHPSTCYTDPSPEDCGDEAEQDDPEQLDAEEDDASQHDGPVGNGDGDGDLDCIPETQVAAPQYFVEQSDLDVAATDGSDSDWEGGNTSDAGGRDLFPLPQVQRPLRKKTTSGEPLIDYSRSIIMTSDDYIAAVTAKAARKEVVAREREERRVQAEQRKAQREEEKARKEAEKLMRRIQSERKKAEREREKLRKASERARKTTERAEQQRTMRAGEGEHKNLTDARQRSQRPARSTAERAWRGNGGYYSGRGAIWRRRTDF